jgi:hypothetical protein
MGSTDVKLQITADNSKFAAALQDSQAKLHQLKEKGSSSSSSVGMGFSSLLNPVTAVVAGITAVGIALGSMASMSAHVKKVDHAFQQLSASAGVSGNKLLKVLQTTSNGAISNLDIMTASNQALKLLGEDAVKVLPQMMEIAMAASNATGVTENNRLMM